MPVLFQKQREGSRDRRIVVNDENHVVGRDQRSEINQRSEIRGELIGIGFPDLYSLIL
jgi:hypothetical protein